MKNNKVYADKSTPYRTFSFNKITAPVKQKGELKSSKITSSDDLRTKRGTRV